MSIPLKVDWTLVAQSLPKKKFILQENPTIYPFDPLILHAALEDGGPMQLMVAILQCRGLKVIPKNMLGVFGDVFRDILGLTSGLYTIEKVCAAGNRVWVSGHCRGKMFDMEVPYNNLTIGYLLTRSLVFAK